MISNTPWNRRHDQSGLRHCVTDITPSLTARLMRMMRDRTDVLALTRGESQQPTPDFITHAAQAAMNRGETGYCPALGIPELRAAIADYTNTHYDVSLSPERAFVTPSGSAGLHLVLSSLINPGDEVIVITPIWGNLLSAIGLSQGKVISVALDRTHDGWALNHDTLVQAVTERTVAILIVTPNNPTGWIASTDDMDRILQLARARNLWVVADEIYHRMVDDGSRAPGFLDVAETDDHLYIVNSFSKNWAMTGWRLGWVIGPPCCEGAIRDLAAAHYYCPSTFLQHGAVAALEEGEPYIRSEIARWIHNRAVIEEAGKQFTAIRVVPSHSTFFTLFQFNDALDCLDRAADLVDRVGLGLLPGCSFGRAAHGMLRMCHAGPETNIREALRRLAAYDRIMTAAKNPSV